VLSTLLRLLGRKPPQPPHPPRRSRAGDRHAQPAAWGPASGPVLVSYAPRSDGRADPGEVVWTAVAFEDDPSKSKDRPVLIIGRRGAFLAGLMLTSKSPGTGSSRAFMDVGRGAWDRHERPSQVRLDRLLDIDPSRVRREGASFDETMFRKVVEAARPFLPELR
jgi:hypothetical protein